MPPPTFLAGETVEAGELAWLSDTHPRARIFRNSNQSIPNNTATSISFTTERKDVGDMFDSGSPTLLTIPDPGDFMVGGHIRWASAAGGFREVRIVVNSVTIEASERTPPVSGDITIQSVVTYVPNLQTNDTLELIVIQTSGGAVNVERSTNFSPEFWTQWVAKT